MGAIPPQMGDKLPRKESPGEAAQKWASWIVLGAWRYFSLDLNTPKRREALTVLYEAIRSWWKGTVMKWTAERKKK
jgi:hypothetical protein